jgi:alpha-tubulin suppressor-like RCC1 family protein
MLRYAAPLTLALVTCTTPPTAVVVRVDTDLDPVTELDSVRVEVARQGGAPVYNFEHDLRSPLYAQLPGEIDVTVRDVDDGRPLAIRVTGTIRGVTPTAFAREFFVTSVQSKTLVLDAWIARACARGAVTCGAGASCGRRGCEPSVRADLPELLSDAVSLVAGAQSTCARRAKGALLCWGATPGRGASPGDVLSPSDETGTVNAQNVGVGWAHRCTITLGPEGMRARRLVCAGANDVGQLGVGSASTTSTEVPTAVAFTQGEPLEVVAGREHTCARVTGRRVWCWGRNNVGQLGDGTTTPHAAPAEVAGLATLEPVALAAFDRHSCALLSDGRVACWGANSSGQLGDGGDAAYRSAPVFTSALNDAIGVSAGGEHTCAVRANGVAVCWGSNEMGQLGAEVDSESRVPVVALDNVAAVAAGSAHSCALRREGDVYCWGSNDSGQLGFSAAAIQRRPTRVGDLRDVVQITAGASHTCARLGTGSLRCWGANLRGQLGDGTRSNRAAPANVGGFP